MGDITTRELNDLFNDTIQRCTYDLVNKDDEIIEYELFEEFDVGVSSFLHENSLNRLLKDTFINNDIKNLCLKLREMYFTISEDKRYAESVRNDIQWAELLKLSDIIKKKKKLFDLSKE